MKEKNVNFKNKGRISKISKKNVISFDEYPDDLEVTNLKKYQLTNECAYAL